MHPTPSISSVLRQELIQLVEAGLKTLLNEKNLYQSVDIPLDSLTNTVTKHADKSNDTVLLSMGKDLHGMLASFGLNDYERPNISEVFTKLSYKHISVLLSQLWKFDSIEPANTITNRIIKDDLEVFIKAPTVKASCPTCKETWPFNLTKDVAKINSTDSFNPGLGRVPVKECFLFCYQCQSCKTQEIYFFVTRNDFKITLTGRSPIAFINPPKEIPKEQRKFFSDALIAHQSGQTLAGIFFLRTLIEQYWLSIPDIRKAVEGKEKPTGEELATAHNSILDDDFKRSHPTLGPIYDALSGAMHSAKADSKLFEDFTEQILEHFQADELFTKRKKRRSLPSAP